jgi:hypothetical protein
MNNCIVWGVIVFLIAVLSLSVVSAQTCMISTGIGNRLLPDTDCDRIIDMEDNCPFIANPAQKDADSNGLGDVCDLYIESINTQPSDFVYNGRAFNTVITLQNNRYYNLRNVKVRVLVPELNLESVQYIDNLEVCDIETLEVMLRAPQCVPTGHYKIIVEASFSNMLGDKEAIFGVASIRVVSDQYCQMVLENNQTIGNTIIDVMQIQDVYQGTEAVFPIRITNMESSDKEYIFSITGLDDWGNSRLEPGSLIIVPSNTESMMNLYIRAGKDAAPGERNFVVSVQSGSEIQRFLLIANIKQSGAVDKTFLWMFTLRIILISGLILLILVALFIGIRKFINSAKSDNIGYY